MPARAVSTLGGYACLIAVTGVLLPLAFVLETRHGPAAWRRLLRTWARACLRLGPVRLRVEGRAPAGAQVVVCNHQSSLDILILAAMMPADCLFVARADLFRIPVVGTVLTRGGHIPLERDRPGAAARMADRAVAELGRGRSLVIFPEGHRSPTGQLGAFRLGAFRIARRAGVDVVPVTLAGTRAILPPGRRSLGSGTVTAVVHRPLVPLRPGETARRQALQAEELISWTLLRPESAAAVAEAREVPGDQVRA